MDIKISDLAQVAAVLQKFVGDCMLEADKNMDAKISRDMAPLRAARDALSKLVGDAEPTPASSEKATGDKARASDSRYAGPTSPWAGTGDSARGHFDTRFSLDNLMTSDGPGELEHTVDSVFNRKPVLGEG